MMAKIVQFEDGTYGVRVFWLPFFGWHFLDRDGETHHSCKSRVIQYCKYKYEHLAVDLLSRYNNKLNSKRHRVITPQPPNSSETASWQALEHSVQRQCSGY